MTTGDDLLILSDDDGDFGSPVANGKGDDGATPLIAEEKKLVSDEPLITFDEPSTTDTSKKSSVEGGLDTPIVQEEPVLDLGGLTDTPTTKTSSKSPLDLNITEEDSPLVETTNKESTTDSLLDFSVDGEATEPVISEKKEAHLDFGVVNEEPQETSVETGVLGAATTSSASLAEHTVGTMDEILEDTIKEFEEREEMISSELEDEKTKIAALESELKERKATVKKLDIELDALGKNKAAIEAMKTKKTKRATKTTRVSKK